MKKTYRVKLVGLTRSTSEVTVSADNKEEAERKAVKAARKSAKWKYDSQVTGVNVKKEKKR